MIRYIHLPEDIEVASMITDHVRVPTCDCCCLRRVTAAMLAQLRVLDRAQQEYKRQMLKT